jgi:hypothetical protein
MPSSSRQGDKRRRLVTSRRRLSSARLLSPLVPLVLLSPRAEAEEGERLPLALLNRSEIETSTETKSAAA